MAHPGPPPPEPWFESIIAEDTTITIAHEPSGNAFLKQDLDGSRTFRKCDLVQLSNALCQHGGDKPNAKTNKKAAAKYDIDCLTNDLNFTAVLTKNEVHSVAMPVDVSTIRNYDLMAKEFKLPPYQVNDTSTLVSAFMKVVGESYKGFQVADEKEFYAATKNDPSKGVHMPKANFEKELLPALGTIIRCNLKFWHLHPWLSRKDAHNVAMEHLRANYKKKGDITKIINDLLLERKHAVLKAKVLELPTMPNPKDPDGDDLVFQENEGAQFILEKFLKAHKHPMDKCQPDILCDMQGFIDKKLKADEKEVFIKKFRHIVPNETAVYLDKKKKLEDKLAAKENKRKAEEVMAKLQLEKKQKAMQDHFDAAAATSDPAAATSDPTDASASPTAATVHRSNVAASTEPSDDIDLTDKFAEFKLKIGETTFAAQKEITGKRRTEAAIAANANRGITKAIVGFHGAKSVKVEYTYPGRQYKKDIGNRFMNVASVSFSLWLYDEKLIEACQEGCNGKITEGVARVVHAVMLHRAATAPGRIDNLGVHESYYEKNFIQDLKKTKDLWLPKPLMKNLDSIHAFYQLVCHKEDLVGLSAKDRREFLNTQLSDTSLFASLKSLQLKEIVKVLMALDEEIESGDFGKKEDSCDVFNTTTFLNKTD